MVGSFLNSFVDGSVSLFVRLFVDLFIDLFVDLFIGWFVCWIVRLGAYVFICLFNFFVLFLFYWIADRFIGCCFFFGFVYRFVTVC